MEITDKKCPRCGETKFITEFYRNSATKDGYYCYCKQCDNERRFHNRKPEAVKKIRVKKEKEAKLNRNTTLTDAIKVFGEEHQLGKIAEECTEYIDAWFHWQKNTSDSKAYEHLLMELADLFVTGWQGRIIGGSKVVDRYIDNALAKLAGEIEARRMAQCSAN